MPDYFDIYQNHASEYDRLVEREDYQHHLLAALEEITPLNGLDVVEFGAGTGRLTCLLAPRVKSIRAFDASESMLAVAETKLKDSGLHNWSLLAADHRQVPAADAAAGLALSGWSMCYLALETGSDWRQELNRGLREMSRVVRPGGILVIIETLGTGAEIPAPPANMLDYFTYLEAHGWNRTWIRTDYLFKDKAEAQELTSFFFGDEMLGKLQSTSIGIFLPECTGVWWKKF